MFLFSKQRLEDEVNAHRPVLQHLCDKRDAVVNLSNKKYIKSDEAGVVANEVNDIVDRYDNLRATLEERKQQLADVEKKVEKYNVVLHPVKETMSAVSVVLESEVPSVTEPELAKEEIVKLEVCQICISTGFVQNLKVLKFGLKSS